MTPTRCKNTHTTTLQPSAIPMTYQLLIKKNFVGFLPHQKELHLHSTLKQKKINRRKKPITLKNKSYYLAKKHQIIGNKNLPL
jgi:hypothetical protein